MTLIYILLYYSYAIRADHITKQTRYVMIRYSNANGKLQKLQKRIGKRVYSFNLPAGHSCPWALDCFSKADKVTGKITDGPAMKFRCYASSLEALYPSVRKMYHSNYEEIKAFNGNADMISEALLSAMPKKAEVIRIHTSGDFFHQSCKSTGHGMR